MAERTSIVGSTNATGAPTWRDDELLAFEKLFMDEGVISGLAVSQRGAGANMSVDIAAGHALVQVTNTNLSAAETYLLYYRNTATLNVSVTTADPTNPRIDRVVILMDVGDGSVGSNNPNAAASNVGEITILAGTPAGSPSAPAEPSNAITLALISVPASDTTIGTAQITDSRTYTKLKTTTLTEVVRQGLGNMVAAGSGTNTVTASYTPTITALTNRMILLVVPANDNTGAVTFNPDSVGATAVRKTGNEVLVGGEMQADVPAILMYHQSDANWKLLNPQSTGGSTLTVENKTADYTVTSGDTTKVLTNTGASGPIVFTLPTPAAGLNYQFAVNTAQPLSIRTASNSYDSYNGNSQYYGFGASAVGSFIELIAVSSSRWMVSKLEGTWNSVVRAGYIGGGYNGSYSDLIQKLRYDTEARSTLSATLASARYRAAGVSGTHSGYFMGGYNGTSYQTNIGGLEWGTETEDNISATLDTADSGQSVQSQTKGYLMGADNAASNRIEDINFANETSAAIVATLPASRVEGTTGTNEWTIGYWFGGNNAGIQDDIYKLTFSGETTATVSDLLNSNLDQMGGNVQNGSTACYMCGDASHNTTIRKFTFSSETDSTIGATLDTGLRVPGGVTHASTKGFWMGGKTAVGYTSQINDMTFSGETSVAIAATLAATNTFTNNGCMNQQF